MAQPQTNVPAAPAISRGAIAWRAVAPYLLVALCSAVLVCCFFKIWKADLRVSLTYAGYGGDDVFQAAVTKTTLETGSYLVNCHLGAPGCQNLYDFPFVDSFHLESVALLARILGNVFLALNLYFFCGPLVASICSLYTLRQLRVGVFPALCGSILYAFLTYFFKRSMAHYSLALYGLCPFLLLFCIWLLRTPGQDTLFVETSNGVSYSWRRIGLAIFVCIWVGCTNIYYSAFFCMLLAFATVAALIRRLQMPTLVLGATLLGAVLLSVGCNLLPSKIFTVRYGPNPEIASRDFSHAEILALKLDQLLLPASGHRVPMLARMKARYNSSAPLVNENDFSSLGMVLSAGFVMLLFWNVVGRKLVEPQRDVLVSDIATLNWAAFLLATIGGAGALIAFFVSDKIRAYNRLTPILAFFSVAGVAICADSWLSRSKRPRNLYLKGTALIALTTLGLLDQSPAQHLVRSYQTSGEAFRNDKLFVQKIENSLPTEAMVFQLPYNMFPEGGHSGGMADYDEFKFFLHSKAIHWSYGAVRGRWEEAWSRQVASLSPEDMLKVLSFAGFEGITIDRYGYADQGKQIEDALTRIVGPPAVVSGDQRSLFFRLTAYAGQLRERLPAPLAATVRGRLQRAVFMGIQGCSGLEANAAVNWRWCDSDVDLVFYNRLQSSPMQLDATLIGGFPVQSNVSIEGPGISDHLRVSTAGTRFHEKWAVAPGRTVVHIHTDAPRITSPGDPRPLYFRFQNLELHEPASNNQGPQASSGSLVPSVSDKFLILN